MLFSSSDPSRANFPADPDEFYFSTQDTTTLTPTFGSPLSELPSDYDPPMNWTASSPSHGPSTTTSMPTSAPKRKRFILDYVLLTPRSALENGHQMAVSSDGPSPNKRARHITLSSPRRNPRRNPGAQHIQESRQQLNTQPLRAAATSPPPKSPSDSERDTFVTDMGNCLDSILNQLAEETQRREALQQMYASGSFGVPSDTANDVFLPSFADSTEPDPFLDWYDEVSDDELSQNLFENPLGRLDLTEADPAPSSPGLALDTTLDTGLDRFLDDAVADDRLTTSFSSLSMEGTHARRPVDSALASPPLGISPHLLYRAEASSIPRQEENGTPVESLAMTAAPGFFPDFLLRSDPFSSSNNETSRFDDLSNLMPVDTDEGDDSVVPDKGKSRAIEPSSPMDSDVVWWAEPDHDDTDRHVSDSDAAQRDSDSTADALRSRCPCNLCFPRATTHPEYRPSRHSQNDIHRLFSLSPFALHKASP
ncbi:hypothetical protein DFH09DRAFT_1370472 [Mycena vulgaris]|nr:hypothetical protein DFH09DRAFT_1370472 [Mycena vulgaris]